MEHKHIVHEHNAKDYNLLIFLSDHISHFQGYKKNNFLIWKYFIFYESSHKLLTDHEGLKKKSLIITFQNSNHKSTNKDEYFKRSKNLPSNRMKEKQMQAMNKHVIISKARPNAVPQARTRYHEPLW